MCVLLIVFGANLGFSQDSIKCFDLEQQRTILKKFVHLDGCLAMRKTDSLYIDTLQVHIDNQRKVLRECDSLYRKEQEINALLNRKIDKKNKWLAILPPCFGIAGWVVGKFL